MANYRLVLVYLAGFFGSFALNVAILVYGGVNVHNLVFVGALSVLSGIVTGHFAK